MGKNSNKLLIITNLILFVFCLYFGYENRNLNLMTTKATSAFQKISVEDSVSTYVVNVSNYIYTLKIYSYSMCIKANLFKQFLIMHPDIDSVTITPSCRGVNYFRKDLNWFEIIIVMVPGIQ